MNNEIFLSLLNWLYKIKRKFKCSVKYVFYFTREVKNMYISFVASPLMKYKYFPLHSMKLVNAIFNKKFEYPLYIHKCIRMI